MINGEIVHANEPEDVQAIGALLAKENHMYDYVYLTHRCAYIFRDKIAWIDDWNMNRRNPND